MIFKSSQPDINVPRDIPIWKWLFDSPASPINRFPASEIRGFTDAVTNARVSYLEMKTHTTHISTALVKHYGLCEGQTVALFAPNTIWYPVAMMSVLRVGGVVSGASPAYNVEEMTYALKTASAKFLMTMEGSMGVALQAAKNAGIPESNIFMLEGTMEGYKSVADLIEMGKKEVQQVKAFELPRGKSNGEVCGFLSFSSGTTGLPKAVMIAHGNVIGQCLQIEPITPKTHRKIIAVLPSFHITGLVHALHLPVLLNAEVYMLPSFTMPSMLSVIVKHQIEEALLVPPILIRMVRDPIVDEYDLRCLKRFSTGAAPVSAEILQQLQQKFPWSGFKQGYGMTESCSCITAHPPTHYDYKYASQVGMICASTQVKIVGEDGRELGIDQPGELYARGPQITMGYLNNPKATAEGYPDGWLRTGDQAMINSEGLVTITDRIKELIKVKGIGIAPAELEDLLLGHPDVEDCAVISIPDDYSGEKPKAFVVVKGGGKGSEETGKKLLKYVRDKKVKHKWLKEVEFVDIIPKSASGKILRRILKVGDGSRNIKVVEEESARSKL